MASVYRILGQSAPAATTVTTVYTVPADYSTVVSTINVCNRSATDQTFRVAIRPGGTALSDQHYIAYDTTIPGNDSLAISIGVTMTATDIISVYTSGNVSFSVFGSEIPS